MAFWLRNNTMLLDVNRPTVRKAGGKERLMNVHMVMYMRADSRQNSKCQDLMGNWGNIRDL